MIELEHNGERYMVDGGQWFRRLKVREVIPEPCEGLIVKYGWLPFIATNGTFRMVKSTDGQFRVPCTDPRPPFVVGQRAKVARRTGDAYLDQLFGQCGIVSGVDATGSVDCDFDNIDVHVSLPPWCLDAVSEPEQDGYTSMPFKKVGTISVRFKKAVPLSPRTMIGDEDVPCLISPADAAAEFEKHEHEVECLTNSLSGLLGLMCKSHDSEADILMKYGSVGYQVIKQARELLEPEKQKEQAQ